MLFSTAGMINRSRMARFACITSRASASAWAAPPMSFFINAMLPPGLILSPPLSKVTPLPMIVSRG